MIPKNTKRLLYIPTEQKTPFGWLITQDKHMMYVCHQPDTAPKPYIAERCIRYTKNDILDALQQYDTQFYQDHQQDDMRIKRIYFNTITPRIEQKPIPSIHDYVYRLHKKRVNLTYHELMHEHYERYTHLYHAPYTNV